MESKKQTAVDWLIDQLEKYELYSKISFQCLKEIEQAKEMHKGEIIDAHGDQYDYSYSQIDPRKVTGEQYYIETFCQIN